MNTYARNRGGRILAGALALAVFALLAGPVRAGVKVAGDETANLYLGGLLQAQGWWMKDGAPDGSSVSTDFYLRRLRLMVYGQINDKISYFIETDSPNFGKDGDLAVAMFIQDAYAEINLHPALQIDLGMLLLPFSHHGMQGATSLLGLDYHGTLIKYPDGSHKVWRDFGFMLRGMPFGDWIEYRLGVFNGTHGSHALVDYAGGAWQGEQDPRNPMDLPRLTARLTFNVFDPEGGPGLGGFFYDGLYIKKTDAGVVSTKRVLSIGGSFDWQRDLNVTWAALPTGTGTSPDPAAREIDERSDYLAAAGDVFWDIPLGEARLMSLNGQVNFFWYDHGDRDGTSWYDTTGSKTYSGIGVMSELGFRYSAFEPLVIVDWFDSDGAFDAAAGEKSADLGDHLGVFGGLNWWAFDQGFNLKLQVGGTRANGADEWGVSGALQAQLLF